MFKWLLFFSYHKPPTCKHVTMHLPGTWERAVMLSCVWLFTTPWTAAYQVPRSMEFSRQEFWSGLPFPSPRDLPDPGIELGSPVLQADALPSEPQGREGRTINNIPARQVHYVYPSPRRMVSLIRGLLPLEVLDLSSLCSLVCHPLLPCVPSPCSATSHRVCYHGTLDSVWVSNRMIRKALACGVCLVSINPFLPSNLSLISFDFLSNF